MKKLFILLVLAIVTIICVGCKPSKKAIMQNVSEVRNNVFNGNGTNFFCNYMSGEREIPYEYDGVSNKMVNFGIVSVWFNTKQSQNMVDCIVEIDGQETQCTLEKSPFEDVFVADIKKLVNDKTLIKISLENDLATLTCISADFKIKPADVIKIASDELSGIISKHNKRETLDGEFYVKILYDRQLTIKEHMWFFSFITKSGKTYSLVIDPYSGDILAKL